MGQVVAGRRPAKVDVDWALEQRASRVPPPSWQDIADLHTADPPEGLGVRVSKAAVHAACRDRDPAPSVAELRLLPESWPPIPAKYRNEYSAVGCVLLARKFGRRDKLSADDEGSARSYVDWLKRITSSDDPVVCWTGEYFHIRKKRKGEVVESKYLALEP